MVSSAESGSPSCASQKIQFVFLRLPWGYAHQVRVARQIPVIVESRQNCRGKGRRAHIHVNFIA